MLRRLSIQNYALIDVLDIEIPEHLVIITGDSGAGKSILLGALALLLGGKADVGVIRDPHRNCVVEAEFNDLTVRRVVTPAGRSRVFVDDEPATMEQIKSIARSYVDIHSQNSQLLLADAAYRLSVVDACAGNEDLRRSYAVAYDALSDAQRELAQLESRIAESSRQEDYIRFQYERLVQAKLKEGELQELEEEQRTLANATEIKEGLSSSLEELSYGESSVASKLKSVHHTLERLSRYTAEAAGLASRVESCRIELKDISSSLDALQDSIEASPGRLETVENRISMLYDLMGKHGAGSVEELIALRTQYESQLAETDDFANKKETLLAEMDVRRDTVARLAKALALSREQAAKELSAALQEEIRALDMPRAAFDITLSKLDELGRSGGEAVEFMFSSAGDDLLKPISKCASGGEMSRIMLCVKSHLAGKSEMPTVIFDEIDTGISGSLADKVGKKIVEMGRDTQVIAITHLPQVAVKGNAHYLVYKEYGENAATSHIRQIEGDERVREIARMISGSEITPEAMANARVLLEIKQ
ncbi:MAG: DNA repair protein RecN [Bacteroidales bacterium]|nr:DNA repair protein RecN [Bacteroidales bacterium]